MPHMEGIRDFTLTVPLLTENLRAIALLPTRLCLGGVGHSGSWGLSDGLREQFQTGLLAPSGGQLLGTSAESGLHRLFAEARRMEHLELGFKDVSLALSLLRLSGMFRCRRSASWAKQPLPRDLENAQPVLGAS